MTSPPVVVDPDTPATQAARIMADLDVGAPVVEHDRLVGMVTDRDLVVRVLAGSRDPETPIGQICSRRGWWWGRWSFPRHATRDSDLDQTLADSFPASDPPSMR